MSSFQNQHSPYMQKPDLVCANTHAIKRPNIAQQPVALLVCLCVIIAEHYVYATVNTLCLESVSLLTSCFCSSRSRPSLLFHHYVTGDFRLVYRCSGSLVSHKGSDSVLFLLSRAFYLRFEGSHRFSCNLKGIAVIFAHQKLPLRA